MTPEQKEALERFGTPDQRPEDAEILCSIPSEDLLAELGRAIWNAEEHYEETD